MPYLFVWYTYTLQGGTFIHTRRAWELDHHRMNMAFKIQHLIFSYQIRNLSIFIVRKWVSMRILWIKISNTRLNPGELIPLDGVKDPAFHYKFKSTTLIQVSNTDPFKECSDVSTTVIDFYSLPNFMSVCVLHVF